MSDFLVPWQSGKKTTWVDKHCYCICSTLGRYFSRGHLKVRRHFLQCREGPQLFRTGNGINCCSLCKLHLGQTSLCAKCLRKMWNRHRYAFCLASEWNSCCIFHKVVFICEKALSKYNSNLLINDKINSWSTQIDSSACNCFISKTLLRGAENLRFNEPEAPLCGVQGLHEKCFFLQMCLLANEF